MKKLLFLGIFLMSLVAEDTCDVQCPDGQKLASFVDGNQARCLCVPEGETNAEQPSGCPSGDCSED